MIGVFSYVAFAAALSGIQTDCTVKGEQAPSFVYTIRDRPGGARDVAFDAIGKSGVLDDKLIFAGTYFSIEPGPPAKAGVPSGERVITNMGSFDRAGKHFEFMALALVDATQKLHPFNLTLHLGSKTIDAQCGNSRAPADEGALSQ